MFCIAESLAHITCIMHELPDGSRQLISKRVCVFMPRTGFSKGLYAVSLISLVIPFKWL